MAARLLANGRYAEATLDGALILNLFDWSVELHTKTADSSAGGDLWERTTVIRNFWVFKCKGYVVPHVLGILPTLYSAVQLQSVPYTLRGYDGSAAGGVIIFQGKAFITQGIVTVPMGMMEQDLEFRGDAAPTVGVSQT
jgi:hypothetical protein